MVYQTPKSGVGERDIHRKDWLWMTRWNENTKTETYIHRSIGMNEDVKRKDGQKL